MLLLIAKGPAGIFSDPSKIDDRENRHQCARVGARTNEQRFKSLVRKKSENHVFHFSLSKSPNRIFCVAIRSPVSKAETTLFALRGAKDTTGIFRDPIHSPNYQENITDLTIGRKGLKAGGSTKQEPSTFKISSLQFMVYSDFRAWSRKL